MQYQVKKTADGSNTIYLPLIDEQYHSLNGAITESMHVFIKNGFLFHSSEHPVVFEVGLGTGLNCLLTAVWAERQKRRTTYITIEKYPLDREVINRLNYCDQLSEKALGLFYTIHNSKWGIPVRISGYFELIKVQMDLTQDDWPITGSCNIVYFDAFAPDKQPEMWTPCIFGRIYKMTLPGGIFVTYSAKGEVRRGLAAVGYEMERIEGPPGKKQMLRGIKVISNI